MMIALWGAMIALLAGCFWLALELRAAREKVNAGTPMAPESDARPVRAGISRFGAMYQEDRSRMSELFQLPGAPALALAGLLIVAGIGLGLLGGNPQSEPASGSAESIEIRSLRASVDSITLSVKSLSDSLHRVAATSTTRSAASTPATQRPTGRRSITPSNSIPPAPVLSIPPTADQVAKP